MHFGVYDAVAPYKMGNVTKSEVLQRLRIQPGHNKITSMSEIKK
jgi:hypothetical protein